MFLGFLKVILNFLQRLKLEFKTLELQNALSFEVQIFLKLRFLFNVLLFEVNNDYLQILYSSDVDLNVSLHLPSPLDYVFDVFQIKLHFIKCFLKPPVLLEVSRLLYLLSQQDNLCLTCGQLTLDFAFFGFKLGYHLDLVLGLGLKLVDGMS